MGRGVPTRSQNALAPAYLSHAGRRFPAEVIGHAAWPSFRFPTKPTQCACSLRHVDEILAACDARVRHEAVRQWALKFGQGLTNQIRRRLPHAGGTWRLDEVAATIAGWGRRGPRQPPALRVLFVTGSAEHAVVGNDHLEPACTR